MGWTIDWKIIVSEDRPEHFCSINKKLEGKHEKKEAKKSGHIIQGKHEKRGLKIWAYNKF